MKILFATLSLSDEPLGIMYISTILKKQGHQVRGVMMNRENFPQVVEEFKPDLIGYSGMDCERVPILKANTELKQTRKGIFSIIGGPLGTFSPDTINDKYIDAVCQGEAEEAMPELINALENGEDFSGIKNFSVKVNGKVHVNKVRPVIKDINTIDFPDREIFAHKKQPGGLYNVLEGRGCPYNCTYCHNKRYKEIFDLNAGYINFRSIDNICEELKGLKKTHNPTMFQFVGDHFFIKLNNLEELAEKYPKEVGVPFICSLRPEALDNEERIKYLKKAGCGKIFTGCEAGNDRIRKIILQRNITKKRMIRPADMMHAYGIKFSFQNMMGVPTSTLDDDIETLELNIRCKPYYAWASICTPYPDTALYKLAKEQNILPKDYLDNIFETYHYRSLLNIPHKLEANILHKVFAVVVEYPELLPMVKSTEFYRDTSEERVKALKKVFDAFKDYKQDKLSKPEVKEPKIVSQFVASTLNENFSYDHYRLHEAATKHHIPETSLVPNRSGA
jgi:radical SAM superfamily enzyme YgiQ (UPF0313 family)|tara:strand:+ start:705 stop:2219 length:1515 start_codon:yes stop_codon:yes gene_type:complete